MLAPISLTVTGCCIKPAAKCKTGLYLAADSDIVLSVSHTHIHGPL